MKKRKLYKIIAWGISIGVVLFITLIIHVAMVMRPVSFDNSTLQLSRIDFDQLLDSAEAVKIKSQVCRLPGVKNAVVNLEDNTLVVGYLNNQQNASAIFDAVMKSGNFKAQLFVPDDTQLSSGCPIKNPNSSFIYRLSAQVNKWVN